MNGKIMDKIITIMGNHKNYNYSQALDLVLKGDKYGL